MLHQMNLKTCEKKMVNKHNLHNHEWLHEMYAKKKKKWAEAYMRGLFFLDAGVHNVVKS